MRALLADDHAILLEGLQNLLEAHGVEVVGAARDGGEAVELARRTRPDLILMDIRMPRVDGLRATRLIKAEMPDTKIVVLTTSSEDDDLFEAVRSGATGYLLKSIDAEALIEALHDAQENIPPFAPGMAAKLLSEFARSDRPGAPQAASPATAPHEAPSPPPSRVVEDGPSSAAGAGTDEGEGALSVRQREVLVLVAQGFSYKEIGARVHLSPRTVKYHMAEIMRKLHLRNRAQVLAYAARMEPGHDGQEPE